jgi:trk system potassium uptake protein TrkH
VPRIQNILHILGGLILVFGLTMTTAGVVGLIYLDSTDAVQGCWGAALLTVVMGSVLWRCTRPQGEITIREGFAVVGLGWAVLAGFGALPYWFAGQPERFTDCYFESMSGLTTTGASILSDIEALPHCLLWWRSFTHWLGGMGIIVLTLALLPLLGYGVMQLYKAEVPGPTADRLVPRVRQTAKLLWLVYLLLSVAEVLLLWAGDMNLFEACCHTFGTMATGGFSTRTGSIGAYSSPYLHWVIIAFMYLAGVNFALHFHLIRRGRFTGYFRSEEFRFYTGFVIVATILVSLAVHLGTSDGEGSVEGAVRKGSFQVLAILTTTGYGIADYELWPAFAQVIIFFLMFTGGCAGSTGGGPKQVRILVLIKSAGAELKRMLHPRAVVPVRLDRMPVSREVLGNVQSFMLLYLLLIAFGAVILASQGEDLLTSISGALSCVSNVGPAFGDFGPTEDYSHASALSKWVLAGLMLVGRLEIYTVVVLVTPGFWRR